MTKPAFRVFAATVAVALAAPAVRSATYTVSTAAEFAVAISAINSAGGEHTISLAADIANFTGASFDTAGTDVTLLGNGHSLAFSNQAGIGNDMYFYVANGAILRLGVEGDATASALDITRAASNDTAGPLYAFQNGTIHMYDGVVVHDCVGHNYYGGGATVYGGLLHMHGGVIRDCGIDGGSVCFGGGVASVDGGRFIMDGGTISGCFVQSDYTESTWMIPSTCGGGVLVYGSSSFVMNGGVIENCTADTGDGAGGGVALIASLDSVYTHGNYGYLDSAFVMNGGTIRGCSSAYMGGGVAAYGQAYLNTQAIGYNAVVTGMNEFQSPPASATEEEKAAIAATYAPAPGLWINGGSVEDCETDNYGGGVFLFRIRPAIHTSIGKATISGCSAEEGGGVAVFNYWTQLAMDGTTVTENTAANAAGVLMSGNNGGGTLGTTMNDVSVTDNVATDADGVGGIYYETDSKLTISGAMDVSGNVAGSERKDSNLNCLGHSYPFYVSGSLEGSVIGLTDPLLLAGGADSDIFLSSGYDANNPGVHPYDRVFTSDHEGWYADYGEADYSAEVRLVKAPPQILVRQRAKDVDEGIILPNTWLKTLGLDHDNVTQAEVEAAEDELNTVQPNGCRLWENIVLGNAETNLLLATVPTTTDSGLNLSLPATSPAPGYGYEVFYELRRADGAKAVLQRDANHAALGIPLYPDDRDDSRNPTGLYRIWSLLIPDSNHAITNEIPTTNIVGVLKVTSPLVNTVTAVPWMSLASDPLFATNIAVSAAVHPANLSADDSLLAYNAGSGVYHGWTRKGEGATGTWEPMATATIDGVTVAPAPENWRPAPGTAFWLTRAAPRDGGGATKPYFLYGQYLPGPYADTVSGGSVSTPASGLCANPTGTAVAVAELAFEGSIGKDDTIVLNNNGNASTVYVRNAANTEWGRWRKTVANGIIRSTWVQDGSIAPGTGFWYVRRTSGDLTVTWPGWEE